MGDPVVPTDVWNSAAFFSSLQSNLAGVGVNAGMAAGATAAAGGGASEVASPTRQVGQTKDGTPLPTKAASSVAPSAATPNPLADFISNAAAVDEGSSVEKPTTSIVLLNSVVSITNPSSSARTSPGTRLAGSRSSRPATVSFSPTSDQISNPPATITIPPEAATSSVNRSTFTTRASTSNTDLVNSGSASGPTRASNSSASSSIGQSSATSVSAGVKAAIALGVFIFIFIVVMTASLLWGRRRKRRSPSELPSRDDKSIGRFELATESSKSNTRRGSCVKPIEKLESPHPASGKYGSFSSDEKPPWRPWRLSRWRGRQELDGGWRPPEMQGRKFHEKSAP